MRRSIAILALCTIVVFAFAADSMASSLPPASYPNGATEYEILFVTSGSTSPTAQSIGTYNSFVTAQANAAGSILPTGLTWNSVVSTQLIIQAGQLRTIRDFSTSANAPSQANIPVYNTQGQLITNLGIYSGSLLSALPEYNQFGLLEQTAVATGSSASGGPNSPLGTNGGWYVGQSGLGIAAHTNGEWLSDASMTGTNAAFPIYGLSAPIQIESQANTPEPATLTLLTTGLFAFASYGISRRRNRSAV
jgi:hypothetical protein